MYRVIKAFSDLQDKVEVNGNVHFHEYKTGEAYPREGMEPSKERVAELSGSDNAQKTPLIEWVEEPESTEGAEKTEPRKKTVSKKAKAAR